MIIGLAAGGLMGGLVPGGAAGAAVRDGAACRNPSAPLSVEEQRLGATLPDNADPSRPQARPFADQMIDGGGFGGYAPRLGRALCRTRTFTAATRLVRDEGRRLWRAAVDRAQRRHVTGPLPYSDDRPLYWTRLKARAVLRQWTPGFALSAGQRDALVTQYDKASRGMLGITYPPGVKRVIMSGFDPYTLDGGTTGTAPGTVGNNIRHGNPSGATALALDGTRYRAKGGRTAVIHAYMLPVNYTEFAAGYIEDTVGPLMRSGVDASVTVSQAVDSEFWLEQWNGRYHGVSPGNDDSQPCPNVGGKPQLAVDDHGCDTAVVPRWGGPAAFDPHNPPQWTTTTLPIAKMIEANTGATVPRPPGDEWPDTSVAFGVIWHTSYTEFPDCASPTTVDRNTPVAEYPPPTAPVPPDPGSCSYSGGGGNYLSNESAYRNTLLRDRLHRHIPAGHIHTPDMQHFATTYGVSDSTFDAWRTAIIAQTRNLVHVVAADA
jgi:hypothetical protein